MARQAAYLEERPILMKTKTMQSWQQHRPSQRKAEKPLHVMFVDVARYVAIYNDPLAAIVRDVVHNVSIAVKSHRPSHPDRQSLARRERHVIRGRVGSLVDWMWDVSANDHANYLS
jgi:hypothetical protein